MNSPLLCVTMSVRRPDFSGQDDDDARTHTPDGDDCLTRMIGADLAETAHALDIFWIQNRKHLVASRIDDRARGKGHLLTVE
jgi:hypothetical protein